MSMFLQGRYIALLLGLAGFINAQTPTKVVTVPKTTSPSPPKAASSHSVSTSTGKNTGGGGSGVPSGSMPSQPASHANGASRDGGGRPATNGGTRNGSTQTPQLSSIYGTHKGAATPPRPTRPPVVHGGPERTTALTAPESRAAVQHLNAMRSHLTGINQRPLPPGNITVHLTGGRALSSAGGRHYEIREDGTLASFQAQGQSVTFFPSGRVASLHTAALDVHTGQRGERTIVSRRPDKSVLVGVGPHSGYLEKTLSRPGNRQVIQRTYVSNGVIYARAYTTYSFHGVLLLHYVPEVYFAPSLYGWVYYPWKPVAFTFSFGSAPWYVANRGYFTPSPVYPSGYSWLADFDLSGVLEKCFDQRSADRAPAAQKGSPAAAGFTEGPLDNHISSDADAPITPTLKDAVSDEVRQQLAYENAAASGKEDSSRTELPAAMQLDHVFVVSSLLEVSAHDDQTCSLSGGDVLQLAAPPAGDGAMAQATVASSKRTDCPVGEIVAVSLQNLQEMQNDLRAEIDNGLRTLRDNQGRDGWPAAPKSAVADPPRPALDGLPPADPQTGDLLEAQQQEAAQAEARVMAAAFAAR